MPAHENAPPSAGEQPSWNWHETPLSELHAVGVPTHEGTVDASVPESVGPLASPPASVGAASVAASVDASDTVASPSASGVSASVDDASVSFVDPESSGAASSGSSVPDSQLQANDANESARRRAGRERRWAIDISDLGPWRTGSPRKVDAAQQNTIPTFPSSRVRALLGGTMSNALPSSWNLPESLRRRVGKTAGKQRLISEEGHLLVILHAIPRPDEHGARVAHFFHRDPSGTWQSFPKDFGRGIAALRGHVELFSEVAESFDDRLEVAHSADDWFALLRELAPFVRTSKNLMKVLEELRTVVGPEPEIIAARDKAADVERTAELVHQWASQGLDYSIAKSNEEQARLSEFISRSSHRLNLLAAATLPITAIGSAFGVNLVSGVESAYAPWLFWGLGALAMLLGLAIRAGMPTPPPALIERPRSVQMGIRK